MDKKKPPEDGSPYWIMPQGAEGGQFRQTILYLGGPEGVEHITPAEAYNARHDLRYARQEGYSLAKALESVLCKPGLDSFPRECAGCEQEGQGCEDMKAIIALNEYIRRHPKQWETGIAD